jgi:hypothetical protein
MKVAKHGEATIWGGNNFGSNALHIVRYYLLEVGTKECEGVNDDETIKELRETAIHKIFKKISMGWLNYL